MSQRFYCKCGCYFSQKFRLTEHIGIANPHWPRTSENDEHAQVTKEDWNKRRAKQYAALSDG